jgi:SAM-dependent methyltransferase
MSADEKVGASSKSILNLGCGEHYEDGVVNVDYYATHVDIRHDLDSFPYPFDNDAFDEIRCYNVVEHLQDIIRVMGEIHRIGKSGCRIIIRVPHFRSACLYEDVTHKHGFAWRTFDIFAAGGTIYGNYSPARFNILSREYTPYKIKALYRLLSTLPVLTDNVLSKYVPMASIIFVLEVIK